MQFLKNNQSQSKIKTIYRAALVAVLMSTTSVYAHFVKPSDDLDEKTRIRGLWQSGTKNNRKEALEILKKKVLTGDYKIRTQYLKKLGEYLKDNPVEIHGAQDILVDQTEGDLVVTKLTPLSSFYNTTLQMIALDPNKTSYERDFEALKLQIFYRKLPEQLIEGSTEALDKGIKKSLLNLQTNRGLSTRLLYKVLYLRNFYTDIDPDELTGIAKKSKQEADSMTSSQENEKERDILYRFVARTYFRVAHDLTLKADINKMISRYQKAADLGYTPAKYMLASLYNDRSTDVYDSAKAYALYSEALKEDPTLAVYSVAGFHELRALHKKAEDDVEMEIASSQSMSEVDEIDLGEDDREAQLLAKEGELAAMRAELDAQKEEQERIKQQLVEESREKDQEQEDLMAAKEAFEEEKTGLAQQKEEVERQQETLTQRQEELVRLEKEGRAREEQLVLEQEALRQANEALRVREEEIIRLQQEHANKQIQLDQTQITLAEKEGHLAQREEGEQARDNQLAQRETELIADREALVARQAVLNEQAEALNRQRTEQQALQQQIAHQQTQLDQRRQALDTREATLNQRQARLDQLQQSLTTKETTLATGQRDLAEKQVAFREEKEAFDNEKRELADEKAKPKVQKKIDVKTYIKLQKAGVKGLKMTSARNAKYFVRIMIDGAWTWREKPKETYEEFLKNKGKRFVKISHTINKDYYTIE